MFVREKHKKIFRLNYEERQNPKIWEMDIDTRFLDMTSNNFGPLRDQLDETDGAITLYKMIAFIKTQRSVLIANNYNSRKKRREWKQIAALYLRIIELHLRDIQHSVELCVNKEILELGAQNTKSVDSYHIAERDKINKKLLKRSYKTKTVQESLTLFDEVHYIANLFQQNQFKMSSNTLV